jgi:septum formation protein
MLSLNKSVTLGSKSPRRQELLKLIIPEFNIYAMDVDESFDELRDNLPEVAPYLSKKKANHIFPHIDQNSLLITSDSVVIKDNKIYNKPEDYSEAMQMLEELQDGSHYVYTGVTITSDEKQETFTCITEVRFMPMDVEELDYYITTCAPYDKAGAYGIQDWIGANFISNITGSYTNVMGLPTHELYLRLKGWAE